jgi:hypothetical protein
MLGGGSDGVTFMFTMSLTPPLLLLVTDPFSRFATRAASKHGGTGRKDSCARAITAIFSNWRAITITVHRNPGLQAFWDGNFAMRSRSS